MPVISAANFRDDPGIGRGNPPTSDCVFNGEMVDDLTTVSAPAARALTRASWRGGRPRLSLTWSLPGGRVDIGLLLFLLLFLDVKLAIKVPVLAVVYWCRPGLSVRTQVPVFYPLILVVAVIEWLLFRSSAPAHYDLVAGFGLLGWVLCLGAAHQVRLFADRNDRETLDRTLRVFFLLNALVSLWDLARIAWEVQAFNPYLYQGMYQKYFIRTGDYIHGVTFDTSTTNALINAFGVVWFLARRQGWMVLCCMGCLLLTGSNFTNLLLLAVLAWMFIRRSDRQQKGGIVLCVLMGVVFLGKVSPQNQTYVDETVARWEHPRPASPADPHAGWDLEDLRRTIIARHYLDSVHQAAIILLQEKIARSRTHPSLWTPKPSLPEPDINTSPYQSRADTTDEQRGAQQFVAAHARALPRSSAPGLPDDGRLPGKIIAAGDVLSFYRAHPGKILVGDGPGNFSSKLAFRATGLNIAGGYPRRWSYVHPDFLKYHLDLFLAYFSKPKESHSLVNTPDSVPLQMLGEYGLLGLGLFAGGYLFFFVQRARDADRRKGKTNASAWPLLVLMTGTFFVGYWFEQLSIVVLFELMIYIDGI